MNESKVFPFPRDDAALAAQRPAPVFQREWLLAGELREWTGPVHDVLSPICLRQADGSLRQAEIGHYPRLGEAEALAAVAAAAAAYDQGRGAWPTMPVAARIRAVEDFALRMRAQREEMVRLLMWEIGKTRGDSEKEFDRTLLYIRDTIDALKDLDRVSSRFTIAEGILAQIRRAPLGVTLCMGPYNYPLNETFTTLIPALIMGNTIVFKPAKFGVLLLRPLLEAFRDAFPAGVVNTVYGEGRTIIGPLMASGKVDCLAFIGTARVADTLKKQHPSPHRLRCVLGLDAKNPAIVLPDADLELALDECLLGALSFNGQRCTALKILFVHEQIYEPFLAGLAERVDRLDARPAVGGGRADHAAAGGGQDRVPDRPRGGRRGARARGWSIRSGRGSRGPSSRRPWCRRSTRACASGARSSSGRWCRWCRSGRWTSRLRYIVESNYGQQVSVFGRDPAALGALIDPLVNQVCRVNLNSQCQRGPDVFPFTGRKDSAEGTLSVSDALRVFSIRALVAAKGTDENKALVTEILRERRSNWLSTDFLF